jgi:hypothetical protein
METMPGTIGYHEPEIATQANVTIVNIADSADSLRQKISLEADE